MSALAHVDDEFGPKGSVPSIGVSISRDRLLRHLFDPEVHAYIVECVQKRMAHPNDIEKVALADRALKQLGVG